MLYENIIPKKISIFHNPNSINYNKNYFNII